MPPEKQTLVILSPGFPENEGDTTCLPLQQALVKAIKKHPGLKIIVFAFQYPFVSKSYTWNGVQVQAFGGKGRGKFFRVYTWLKVWAALKKLKKSHKIAGILSFWMGECAFIGQRFANKHHLSHHCWVLGQDAKPGNHYFNWITPNGRSLIAISDFIARNLYINYGVMPRHIIPGGIDERMFAHTDGERDIDIMGAGSLIPLKQYHLFIEVIARLKPHFPQINVVLCGDGPEHFKLKQLIKKLKLEKNITLTGEVAYNQVLTMMQRTKIFLHTANYEGLGMVCLEALYAGAKVVSMVRPMDSVIENWHIAKSPIHMASIITGILQDNDMMYPSVKTYNIDDIAGRIARLYLDKPAAISLNLPAIALNESVEV